MTTNNNKTKIFTLRIRELLLEKVKNSAEKNYRSMAKEIEFALEKYYKTEGHQK